MADNAPTQPAYTGNADAIGFDPSFMLAGPGIRVVSGPTTNYLYRTPDGSGKSPLTTWQGVIDEVNNRIFAGAYISSLDTSPFSQDFVPGYTVPNFGLVAPLAPLANAKPRPPAPPAPPLPPGGKPPKANRSLDRTDFLVLRDALRIINPHIVFQPIPRVLSSTAITDLLMLRWIQRTDFFVGPGILYQTTTTSQATAFNITTSACPPTAYYEFDMGTGMGSNIYTWWAPQIPSPDQLLAQWAAEDAFVGATPQIRGKLAPNAFDGGFLPLGDGNTMTVQGDWTDTFTFRSGLGAISGGTLGANVHAAHDGSDSDNSDNSDG